jgi:hypothetical protein
MRRRLSVVPVLAAAVLLLIESGASAGWNPVKRQPDGVAVEVHQAGGPGAYSEAGASGGVICQRKRYQGECK